MLNRTTPASSHNHVTSAKQISRFANLRSAGVLLAEKLREQTLDRPVVLAIASGGVPVGHEVARQLQLPFDLVIIKRLLLPPEPGPPVCAVSVAGTTVLDDRIDVPTTPATPIGHFIVDALKSLRERDQVCRGGRSEREIANCDVVLIDCGVDTGSTMAISIGAVRKLKPTRIICGAPMASRQGLDVVTKLADETVCLAQPEPFGHTGMWYEDFSRPNDEQVGDLLNPI